MTLVNFIVLLLVYIVGVGASSLLAKLAGKKLLDLGFKDRKSYWVDSKMGGEPVENYYKQF